MKHFKNFMLFFAAVALISVVGCKDPEPITVGTIVATGTDFSTGDASTVDLNGATAAIDVPLDAVITITTSRDYTDQGTISLTVDNEEVPITVTGSGNSIVVTPDSDLTRGTVHVLNISNVVTDDEATLTTTRSFTTAGRAPVVVPNAASQMAYYNFDANYEDQVGTFDGEDAVAITYGEDRFGQRNSTATFDGDASVIVVPNADQFMANKNFTLAFWIKTNSVDHVDAGGNPASHFVMGLGAFKGFQFEIPASFASCKLAMSYEFADGTTGAEDLWFPGDGNDAANGGWQGWDYVADLTGSGGVEGLIKDKWAHIVCSYDAANKTGRMYINGELMKSFDFNLWPEGDAKQTTVGVAYTGVAPEVLPELAIGFIHSPDGELWDAEPWGGYEFPTANHFKGDLDDIRIFSAAFSANDAKALYDAEKP